MLLRRTPSSATPTTTLERTSALADPTQSGSVIASLTRRSRLSGPTISTVGGSADIRPTMNPGAGSPSTEAITGTTRMAEGSKRIATDDGVTCVTTTANGALTRSVDRWKRRRPGWAALKSTVATRSPGAMRPSASAVPRTRTSTDSWGGSTISRFSGRFCNSRGMRSPRSTDARCDDTIIHRTTASAIETIFNPVCANGCSRRLI